MPSNRRSPRRFATIAPLIVLVIAIVAAVSYSVLHQDANASGVRVAEEPRGAVGSPRIAALLPFAADQLLTMGARPVAVPSLRGEAPEAWKGLPTIAMDHSAGPNLEQLIAVSPDVVITSSVYAQFTPMIERSTGAEIVVMDVESINGVAHHIRRLGELAKRPEAAAAVAAALQQELTSSTRPNADAAQPLPALAVFGTPHAFYAFLPSSYLGDLVAHAGGELITSDLQSHGVFRGLAPLSMEAVIDRDPALLLVVFHGPEQTARAMLESDPLWSGLSAVREGNVTFLSEDLYAMRPGSDLPRAMREIVSVFDRARAGDG